MQFQLNSSRNLHASFSTSQFNTSLTPNQIILQSARILVPCHLLENQYKHYEWRSRTQFPIVKVNGFKLLRTIGESAELEIKHEVYPVRLIELKDIALFKLLYLLKESTIGFERLYDRFGSFLVTPKMVAINQQHKCKVWLSQNFASNEIKCFKIDEKYFLISIYKIFESRCLKTKSSILFFQELNKCKTFCTALGFIQLYAKQNKISIPSFFKTNSRELASNQNKGNTFDPSMTMSRAPKFLNQGVRQTIGLAHSKQITENIKKQMQENQINKSQFYLNSQEEDRIMKKSGQTAVDLFTSNTSPTISQKQIFQEDQDIPSARNEQKFIFKSEMQPKSQKKGLINLKRKFSNNQYEYKCFTPKHELVHDKQKDKWSGHSFLFPEQTRRNDLMEDQNQDELNPAEINNLFTKNKWQRTIDGLFNNVKVMKKSIHEGKQVTKTPDYLDNLQLLGKIGKQVYESMMQGQNQCNEDYGF